MDNERHALEWTKCATCSDIGQDCKACELQHQVDAMRADFKAIAQMWPSCGYTLKDARCIAAKYTDG